MCSSRLILTSKFYVSLVKFRHKNLLGQVQEMTESLWEGF